MSSPPWTGVLPILRPKALLRFSVNTRCAPLYAPSRLGSGKAVFPQTKHLDHAKKER